MRIITLLIFVALSAGCSTTHSLALATVDQADKPLFAPVSVLIDDGTGGNGNAWPHDQEMYKQIAESGLFTALGLGGGNTTLVIKLESEHKSSSIPALLSAFTLFIVPYPSEFDLLLRAVVLIDDKPVKVYQYVNNEKTFDAPILDMNEKGRRKTIEILMSNLLADLARDRPFPVIQAPGEKPRLRGV